MSPPIPPVLGPLLGHPVAIFGDGVSGRAALALVHRLGGSGAIFDERGGEGIRREFSAGEARLHRLVVFSPGFVPDHPWLVAARAAGAVCLGELDFAALCWRGSIVAVTGTNGKTTLVEFLTHALRLVGRDAVAVGNIGFPFSRHAADVAGGSPLSIAVCEVSSFQAETLRHFRAASTLWTNFAEDHLERHATLRAYFLAKWRLVECTAPDRMLAGTSVRLAANRFGLSLPASAWVMSEGRPPDGRLAGTVFGGYPQRENFLLVAAWWRAEGLPAEELFAAARSFHLGPHRLARVGARDGVTWWNDSKATNFHAVAAALEGFAAPVILIAGGKSKGGDIAAFVRRIAPRVRYACLIGETRSELAEACSASGVAYSICHELPEAVRQAAALARPGDHVLLSPAFASFDQFQGYADRGTRFTSLVRALSAPAPTPASAPVPALQTVSS
jgi:UDP-N-acetylmuramoylalanine--D-glutamate ligase